MIFVMGSSAAFARQGQQREGDLQGVDAPWRSSRPTRQARLSSSIQSQEIEVTYPLVERGQLPSRAERSHPRPARKRIDPAAIERFRQSVKQAKKARQQRTRRARVSGEYPSADEPSSWDLIIAGRKYKTLKEFKRERFKDLLQESFFQANIDVNDFTDDELVAMIKEIRQRQVTAQQDRLAEMKKMMRLYNQKKNPGQQLSVDLNKMKTIVIQSSGSR
jgi:hypothetical protein